MAKRLINTPESVVTDALDGLVLCHPHLQRLDGYPGVKVIINAEHDKSKVALISGGGSGHEPAHAGYVGNGMLAAAVCGDIFASPAAEAVLAAIRVVTGPAGCLLIVKNYTGDRIHFGLAADQAKAEGYAVSMVVVGEDCAISATGLAGRRGLSGTVFVHKMAGALAAAGAPLADVLAAAQRVAGAMGTLGVASTVCTLPGKAPSDRLGPGDIEVGLGIHGEPGFEKRPWQPVGTLVPSMLARITDAASGFLSVTAGERMALMVNNLGGSPPMEMHVVAGAALRHLTQDLGLTVERVFVGHFMTSLEMAGASLTLLKLESGDAALLDAATAAPAWPAAASGPVAAGATKPPRPLPASPAADALAAARRPAVLTAGGAALEAAVAAACRALIAAEPDLTRWDGQVGDGDCGDTFKTGAQAILADLAAKYDLNAPATTAQQIAHTVRHSVGGTSGGLYDVFFTAAATCLTLRQQPSGTGAGGASAGSSAAPDSAFGADAWSAAFSAGVDAVQQYGGARAGCRTMLDALLPAKEALVAAVLAGKSGAEAVQAMAAAAAAGAEGTKGMAALAGRSSYVPESVLASVPDPGAMAAAVWLGAVAKSICS